MAVGLKTLNLETYDDATAKRLPAASTQGRCGGQGGKRAAGASRQFRAMFNSTKEEYIGLASWYCPFHQRR